MIRGIKVRLYPTKEQEKLMWKSAGVRRVAYNYGLAEMNTYYQENKHQPKKGDRYLKATAARSKYDIFKQNVEGEEGEKYLLSPSQDVGQGAFQDLNKAFKNFASGKAELPKFKSRKSPPSFYHDPRKIKVYENRIYFEKIGWVTMKDEGRLPQGDYKKKESNGIALYKNHEVCNPRIKHDGKSWYLAIAFEQKVETLSTENLSIGIDLGIKQLATTNIPGLIIKNINKDKRVKKYERRMKRQQKQLSRKREANMKNKVYYQSGEKKGQLKSFDYIQPLKDCKNYQKQKRKLAITHRKLTNIRNNHLHQATNTIIKQKPSKIVMEDLNIKGMMKNKHLSKSIAQAKWSEFRRQMDYKAKSRLGFEVIIVDRFYPSSQLCSSCGVKYDSKIQLEGKWSQKIDKWTCKHCESHHDRDINASINLANYSVLA